jgi:hypothetical protein
MEITLTSKILEYLSGKLERLWGLIIERANAAA